MLYNLLSNRWLQCGLLFFVAVVGGSLLYSWHVRRTTEIELAPYAKFLQEFEAQKELRAAEVVSTANARETDGNLPEISTESHGTDADVSEITEVSHRNAELPDVVDADVNISDTMSEASDAVEAAPYGMSPYGFGPFPAVPPDYPDQGVWSDGRLLTMSPGHELISRVRIKLWDQGIRSLGGVYDNEYNLIYPIFDDVAYIKWAEKPDPDGSRYVERVLTSPATDDRYDLHRGGFPPHLTVYEFPDGGIDPHDFLGLSR